MNKWRLVDVDNFMRGNAYFTKVEEADVWQKRAENFPPGEVKIYKEKERKEDPHYERDVL